MKPGTHTFKAFQAIYPDDAACLEKLMEVNYGGTEITCPGCGAIPSSIPLPSGGRSFASIAATTFTRPPERSSTSRARTSPSGFSRCTS